ncbi:MAG TPA: uroporphyrinogen-III C-methyltransferase [Streptosporangiaceae bacterium]|nr:uroporphyrinogen-III C-methyltransferase [Streptosporangiaceae bacterium]
MDWTAVMDGYPVEIDLRDRLVVVVGGGHVALRRARALTEAAARVVIVAPRLADGFAGLPVTVRRRRYRDGDLAGAWLAHAATDDPAVNAAVAAEAERARIWCVRADDGAASTARVPAVTRHGDVTVAVTAGGDPRRSQHLRSAIAAALAGAGLPTRRHRRGGAGTGGVALVGGGPGDPGLITVLGRRLLAEADVVVADRLGPRELLDELDPDVEVVEAGKAPGAHRLTQEQINELIVARAKAGLRVVRLKGGDPFVFGRGGEEALACVRAGVPVRVVLGVTSAVAGPAYAGIPVTHRGIAQEFRVISAHVDPSAPGAAVDWAAAAGQSGTLVLLMAVGHIDAIAAELIKRGRNAATPVAVIREATLPGQQVLVTSLERVASACAEHGIRPPAVVVVGDVVGLSEELAAITPLPAAAPASANVTGARTAGSMADDAGASDDAGVDAGAGDAGQPGVAA